MTEHRADVLIVEDSLDQVELLDHILGTAGYAVRVALTGAAAQEAWREKPPDLILLDLGLPDTDGFTLCEELKADPITAGIPVLIVSARWGLQDKIRGFQVGAVDYITKPVDSLEVLARVGTHVALGAAHKELVEQNSRLETALAEVKTLRGFLPICSYCKKIRDDEGYWTKLEQYLAEHAEATFTHGICPTCLEEKFPEHA